MEQLPLPADADRTCDPPSDPTQAELPFGELDERPVPFALTSRARRAVAPDEVPALRVVSPPAPTTTSPSSSPMGASGILASLDPGPAVDVDVAADVPADTRPARARALRRAGTGPAAIAAQLGVDPLLVRAWTDGVHGVTHVTALPPRVDGDEDAARRAAFASARTSARGHARTELAARPELAGGCGVLAAAADIAPDGVTVTTSDERVAATAVRWAADVLDVGTTRWRVVLRLGERAAADLARHRWSQALGLPPERVRTTRWVGAVDPEAEEVRLRLADPVVAAEVAGWCDTVLEDPAEQAF